MKISLQLGLLPGRTPHDQALWARDHGADAIELGAWGGIERLRREADEVARVLPVSSVCGNADLDGHSSFDFLDPDPAKRRKSIDGCKAILALCGEVGAAGQIVPPIFGGPRVPDLSPVMTPLEIEERLMIAICQEIGPWAQNHGTRLLLEPLNRYEQHYLRKQSDGVRVIEASGAPGLALLSDLFHMHIEETDTPRALRDAGAHVAHLHLADNTRLEPGTGDIDFLAAFQALRAIGFSGYMAFECGLSGASADERAANLARSVAFVRDAIERSAQ